MMWYRYPVHTVSVAARSHLAYFFASSHQLPACLPSFRSSSRRTGRIVVSPVRLPALRHGWAGREAGSVGVLLAWFYPAICCTDVDRSVHAVSSCDAPSVCLPVVSAAGGAIAFSSCPCGACCDVLAYRPSARLVSRPVLRHDGLGGGRMR